MHKPSHLPSQLNGTVTSAHPLNRFRQGFARDDFWRSFPTAFLCWFLTVIFSVSLAALIFRGPLEPYLSIGIGMSLFSAVVVGLITTLIGSVPGTIAIPSDRTAPMLAILAASVAAAFPPNGSDDAMIRTCLAALLLSTFLTGIMLALLGHYRLGRLIRFLPFPVVGGFMAGAGWLLVKGALTVLTDLEMNLADVPQLFHAGIFLRWGPAVAMACCLIIATRRLRHFLVVPGIVLASMALFYGVAWFQSVSLSQLRSQGWLPGPFPQEISWHPVTFSLLTSIDWVKILGHADTFATILLVSATSLLLISSAMELAAQVEVDADRELEAAGVANLVAVLGGGLVGFHSLSVTSLALRIGPPSRWVGLLTAIGSGITLWVEPNLVSYLPIPVLGGLLFYLGLNFLTEWLIDSRLRMPRSDYLIIVLILLVVAWAGYIVGVGVGLIMAVALFALRYSMIDIVRLEISGTQHRSNVDRTPEELALLAEVRPSILILKLQGFIFFGTAHSLLHRIRLRAHAIDQPPLQYVFMDFRHVTGLDSSTLLSFSKLLQVSRQLGFQILCTSLSPAILRALRRDPSLFAKEGFLVQSDIDHAMEWCEMRVLEPYRAKLSSQVPELTSLLQSAVPQNPEVVQRIVRYFIRQDVAAGSVLAVQGERTRDLFLIQKGQVSAQFKASHGESIRLRTMGAGSVVGEIGLYLHLPRTASLVVDTESIVWKLSPEKFATMEAEDPQAAAALHEFLARIVASRLVQANELLEITLR